MEQRPTFIALLVAAMSLLIVVTAGAQNEMEKLKSSTPEERARLQTEMMKTKLSLTTDQTPKVAAINQKYAQRMEPIIKSQEGPLMRLRQMREVGQAKEAELKGVLSPEQFQKYLAEKQEMREKFEDKLIQ
jgi:Spy/CpxP family protein refolding chaperone